MGPALGMSTRHATADNQYRLRVINVAALGKVLQPACSDPRRADLKLNSSSVFTFGSENWIARTYVEGSPASLYMLRRQNFGSLPLASNVGGLHTGPPALHDPHATLLTVCVRA